MTQYFLLLLPNQTENSHTALMAKYKQNKNVWKQAANDVSAPTFRNKVQRTETLNKIPGHLVVSQG